MQLTSQDFDHNEEMDSKFTCDGDDISPHLKWDDVPNGTKCFAVSCNDPDAPAGDWVHWYVYNIPDDTREIAQNGPVPGKQAKNDFGKKEYGGPCPPSGTHRYFFRVYALDEELKGVKKSNFKKKVKQHTLEKAEMIGLYTR
ncbi:MAG: YbhB/YbcL family Raf kinase inhibitor-like protein [Promethearchaeia archaeon]